MIKELGKNLPCCPSLPLAACPVVFQFICLVFSLIVLTFPQEISCHLQLTGVFCSSALLHGLNAGGGDELEGTSWSIFCQASWRISTGAAVWAVVQGTLTV